MSGNELVVQQGALMPVMQLEQVITRYNYMKELVSRVMVEGLHYGKVPGTDKDTLLKAGAEMLTTVFGLVPGFEISEAIERWDAAEPFFYYRVHCRLYHNSQLVGEADGSCNSREGRYHWRWVDEADVPPELDKSTLKRRGGRISEFTFAVDKAETSGKYGKPEEYWQRFTDAIEAGTAVQVKKSTAKGAVYDAWEIDSTVYRVPNEDIYSQVNTILKMAEKRALVAATLVTVNASDFFTQDMEDLVEVPVTVTVINPTPQPPAPQQRAAIDDAAELDEARREWTGVEPEPPTARRSWPGPTVKALVDAHLADNPANAVNMLNLSKVLRTTDELELVMTWATHYRGQREDGADPDAAAQYADAQLEGIEEPA